MMMGWWWCVPVGLIVLAALVWLAYEIWRAPVHDEDRDGPWAPPPVK